MISSCRCDPQLDTEMTAARAHACLLTARDDAVLCCASLCALLCFSLCRSPRVAYRRASARAASGSVALARHLLVRARERARDVYPHFEARFSEVRRAGRRVSVALPLTQPPQPPKKGALGLACRASFTPCAHVGPSMALGDARCAMSGLANALRWSWEVLPRSPTLVLQSTAGARDLAPLYERPVAFQCR